MIKLITGTDSFLIDELILKEAKRTNSKPIYFDGQDRYFKMEDLYFETIAIDLFYETKFIVVKNAVFLSSKVKLLKSDEEILNKIQNEIFENVSIFFILNDLKFDSKKKIVKAFKNIGELIQLGETNSSSIKQALLRGVEKYKITIDSRTLDYLNSLLPDYQSANSAIEKLRLFEGIVTIDVLEQLVVDESELVIFDLSNALIEKRINDALVILHKLKLRRIDISGLVYILASKIRQIYQMLVLKKLGYNQNELGVALSISPNYAWVLMNKYNHYLSIDDCLRILKELAQFDQKSKIYMLDRHLEFELWVLEYGRKYGKS